MELERYDAVFRASPDGIVVVDETGRILDVNPMAEQLFGYSRAELVGEEIETLVPGRVRGVHAANRLRYMTSPTARPMGIGMELAALRRDGSEITVEISLSPLDTAQGVLVIATVRDVTQRRQLRDFGAAALRASEAERKHIARELHDDTAQRLAALLLRLRILERDTQDPGLSARLAELRDEIAGCAEGVRRIARGLRPPELEDAGIAAALRAHARALREGTGLAVELNAEAVDELLDPDGRLVLYRIVQEALSNVVRHSGAASARVVVQRSGQWVLVRVSDEGRGFGDGTPSTLGGGLGLLGMQERAAGVGGRVAVESEAGRGTEVTIMLPVLPAGGDATQGKPQ